MATGLSSSLELFLSVAAVWDEGLEPVGAKELPSFVGVEVACCTVAQTGETERLMRVWMHTSSWRNEEAGGDGRRKLKLMRRRHARVGVGRKECRGSANSVALRMGSCSHLDCDCGCAGKS